VYAICSLLQESIVLGRADRVRRLDHDLMVALSYDSNGDVAMVWPSTIITLISSYIAILPLLPCHSTLHLCGIPSSFMVDDQLSLLYAKYSPSIRPIDIRYLVSRKQKKTVQAVLFFENDEIAVRAFDTFWTLPLPIWLGRRYDKRTPRGHLHGESQGKRYVVRFRSGQYVGVARRLAAMRHSLKQSILNAALDDTFTDNDDGNSCVNHMMNHMVTNVYDAQWLYGGDIADIIVSYLPLSNHYCGAASVTRDHRVHVGHMVARPQLLRSISNASVNARTLPSLPSTSSLLSSSTPTPTTTGSMSTSSQRAQRRGTRRNLRVVQCEYRKIQHEHATVSTVAADAKRNDDSNAANKKMTILEYRRQRRIAMIAYRQSIFPFWCIPSKTDSVADSIILNDNGDDNINDDDFGGDEVDIINIDHKTIANIDDDNHHHDNDNDNNDDDDNDNVEEEAMPIGRSVPMLFGPTDGRDTIELCRLLPPLFS
jgi:hypothetical protein